MTEPSDLDDRLARLAARQARTSEPAPEGRVRRRHPAAAARILSLGLSSSAFLSMVAAFGQNTPRPVAAARPVPAVARPARARPRTRVIVKYVHHTVFVDRAGRPITGGNRQTAGATPPRWITPATNAPSAGTPVAAPAAPTVPNAGAPTPGFVAPPPAPAPRPTTPPPTVVTTPPPPAPPVCSGTQCP